MGCDGVFEKLTNDQLINTSLKIATKTSPSNVFERSGAIIDSVLNSCVEFKTLDNITAVMIGFRGLGKIVESKRPSVHATEIEFDWDK